MSEYRDLLLRGCIHSGEQIEDKDCIPLHPKIIGHKMMVTQCNHPKTETGYCCSNCPAIKGGIK